MTEPTTFFTQGRFNIFRPLAGKWRELASACIQALYGRLYGPSAEYSTAVSQEALRALFAAAIQGCAVRELPSSEISGNVEPTDNDPYRLASVLVRDLRDDGWIEPYYDSARLAQAYRFTRHGKILAEAIVRVGQPAAQSRHRNLRACRNSLQAFLSGPTTDTYELIDAFDCAQRVIEDINENISLVYEHARVLIQEAAQTSAWDEFQKFMERFERNLRPQFTSEHVDRHRFEIRDLASQCRRIDAVRIERVEADLASLLPWAQEQRTGSSTFFWILDRIEDLVDGACGAKQPELLRAVHEYTRRITALLREVMAIRLYNAGHSIEKAIEHLGALAPQNRESVLSQIGWNLSVCNVRLTDPASIELRNVEARRKVSTKISRQAPDEASRLKTEINRAIAGAFSIPQHEALQRIELATAKGPIRVSALPQDDALQVLLSLHAPEIARIGAGAKKFEVTKLSARNRNAFYETADYLITKKGSHP